MADDSLNWIKVAESEGEIDFGLNNIAEVMAGERRICIGKFQENLFAFSNKCPHASGLFINGYIDALGNVVCPIHRYKFCMRNGRNITGEGYFLKYWQLQIRDDGIYVGLEKNKLFGIF
jgi:3-phenylpropionate/trans-cinnamate dioxygenase ferredoxin subunit